MSATRELRRRLRAEQSVPRFDPCLPRPASEPPVGPGWIHEIKHDGFRILAHRRGRSVRLFSRNGRNIAERFPLAAAAIEALPVRSCVVDGEAIVCDDNGLAVFDLVRGNATNARIVGRFELYENWVGVFTLAVVLPCVVVRLRRTRKWQRRRFLPGATSRTDNFSSASIDSLTHLFLDFA
jgi:ATP dependent DNA ligase domain